MRIFQIFILLFLATGWAAADSEEQRVAAVLDDFHLAASEADGARYFAHFAPQGVFIGTDISERWNVQQFKDYAMPFFSKGKGWTYRPKERNIDFSADGQVAWFDEILDSQNFGATRGSGVLLKLDGEWKIAQYHLTVPVPNELLEEVVERIQSTSR